MTRAFKPQRQTQKTSAVAASRSFWSWKVFAAAVLAFSLFLVTRWQPKFSVASSQSSVNSNPVVSQSVYDLMKLSPEELDRLDIGRLNLLCAQQLPGSDAMSIQDSLALLDEWARKIKLETQRHLYRFEQSPSEFENSLAYFKMIMLVTVLQQDLGLRYNPERALKPDFRDSRDLFIHGLLGESRSGTCLSMPALYVAIGRRLGYPLFLAQAKEHLYVKWEDDREKLNIEATSQGLVSRDDAYYAQWPKPLSRAEMRSGAYLRKLSGAEAFAVFLMARGHCLEDNGSLPEAQAMYALAHAKAPTLPNCVANLALAMQRENPGVAKLFAQSLHAAPSFPGPDARAWVDRLNEQNRRRLEPEHYLPPNPTSFDPQN